MTFSQTKKVSVVVPNYNYAKFLKKRLKSILKQAYPIYELIILDDKSGDGSEAVIRQEMERIWRERPEIKIKFIKNDKNSGKAIRQWKKGFEEASGDYIWIAEADDLCRRNFLAEVMRWFDDPDVVISYAESQIINSYGMVVVPNFRWSRDKERTGHYKKSYIKDGKTEIQEILAVRCTIPNVSAVVMKNDPRFIKFLEEAEKFDQVGDWYFYVKVLENGKISYNHKALNKFRVHGDSKTGQSKKGVKHYDEIVWMHEWLLEKYKISKKVQKYMRQEETRVWRRCNKVA